MAKKTPNENLYEALKENLEQIKATPLIQCMTQLKELKDQPRLQVIIAHAFVELIISVLVNARCKNARKIGRNEKDFPHSFKLLLLHEMNILSDHHYKLLDWFRKLRNKAAHDWDFVLTKDSLSDFEDPKFSDPKEFHNLCGNIIGDLFTEFTSDISHEILGPDFVRPGEPVLMAEIPAPAYKIRLKSDPKTIHVRASELL